jgi:CheY-like chemotaxis protein
MTHRILFVNPDETARASAEQALAGFGYRVVALGTFREGVQQVAGISPDLLVTSLRLHAFNGLHLVLRSRTRDPELPAIVLGELQDLTPDVSRLSARFISTPIDAAAFPELVAEMLRGRLPKDANEGRIWPRKRTAMTGILAHGAVRAADLSYGGVCLKSTAPPQEAQEELELRLPAFGVSVSVVPRWSRPAPHDDGWCCGAEVRLQNPAAISAWRSIVDSVE